MDHYNIVTSIFLLCHSHVTPEQYRHRFACVTFTVMDYDWLSTNDFAGDAVAPLSDFCWPGRPTASPGGKNLQPLILHLSREKPSGIRSTSHICGNDGGRGYQDISALTSL